MSQKTADRIRTAMDRRGLTDGGLAVKCGISKRMIRYYRSGHSDPGGYALRCLSRALGVSADWLLGLDEEERQDDDRGGIPGTSGDKQEYAVGDPEESETL